MASWKLKWSSGTDGTYSTWRRVGYVKIQGTSSSPPVGALFICNGTGQTSAASVWNGSTFPSTTNLQAVSGGTLSNLATGSTSYSGMSPLPTSAPSGYNFDSIYYTNPKTGSYPGVWAMGQRSTSEHDYSYLYRWYPDYTVTVKAMTRTSSNTESTTGGTVTASSTSVEEGSTTKLTATAKTGYTFKGWSTSSTAASGTTTNPWTVTVNSTVTYYAIFQANSYTISYNANGGSNAPTSGTKYYNVSFTPTSTAPTAPTGGWTFKGWSTSTANAAAGTTISSYTTNAATTLYACWQRDVKQAYNLNGGSGTTPSTQTLKQYRSGSSVSTANFTTPSTSGITAPSGWGFSSWSTSSAATGGTTYGASATSGFAPAVTATGASLTRTLYARWSRSVKFYGGVSNAQIGSAVTQYRGGTDYSTITPSGVPTAISGWTALGWRDDTSAAAKLYGGNSTSAFSYTGTKTAFYAVYSRSIDCYSGISKATTTAGTQYRNGGTYAVAPPGITSLSTYSWTSLGWRDDTTAGAKEYGANNTNLFAYSGNGPLYAVYSRTLTINYAAGGGSGTAPSATTTTQYYNSGNTITSPAVTLRANPYTRKWFNFAHWNVSTSNTNVASSGSYTWNNSIGVTSTTYTRTATAQWTALLQTKVSGTWKPVTAVYTKVNGIWKTVNTIYTKVNNAWKHVGS